MSYEQKMKDEATVGGSPDLPSVRIDTATEIAREADMQVSECQAAIAQLENALAKAGIRVTAGGEISADWFNGADGVEQVPLDEWLKRRREAAVMLSVVDPSVKNGLVQLNQALNARLDRIRKLEQQVEFWSRASEEELQSAGSRRRAADLLQMAEVEAARVRGATPEMVTECPPCANFASPAHVGSGAVIGFSGRELGTHAVATEVVAERLRQIRDEGYSPGHDDEYALGELALGAAAYALNANKGDQTFKTVHGSLRIDYAGLARQLWPWRRSDGSATIKPGRNRRNLVKAAAMLMAEIERIDRANARAQS